METNKWGLKLLSLVIAIFLWIFVLGEVNPEITRTYYLDIEFTNEEAMTRKGLSIIDYEDTKIAVRVTGKKSDLDNFRDSQIKALIDLSLLNEGEEIAPISVVPVSPLSSLVITDYQPREIKMNLDSMISVEKKIELVNQGQLPEGYIVGDIKYDQDRVVVNGPRTQIDEIDTVAVFIDLEDKKESFSSNVPIRTLNSSGDDVKNVSTSITHIDVSVPIYKIKTVNVRAQADRDLGDDRENLKLTPDKVGIYGENVDSINFIYTNNIDIDALKRDGSAKVKLSIPEGVVLVDKDVEVSVIYIEGDLLTRDYNFPVSNLVFKNISDGLDVEILETREFKITVAGEQTILKNFSSSDIELSVDLKDFVEGTYKLPVTIEVPMGIIVNNIDPIEVELIVKRG